MVGETGGEELAVLFYLDGRQHIYGVIEHYTPVRIDAVTKLRYFIGCTQHCIKIMEKERLSGRFGTLLGSSALYFGGNGLLGILEVAEEVEILLPLPVFYIYDLFHFFATFFRS